MAKYVRLRYAVSGWSTVVKGLVEADLVSLVHPLEGSDLLFKNVIPSMVIDQLILIRAVDVLGQGVFYQRSVPKTAST